MKPANEVLQEFMTEKGIIFSVMPLYKRNHDGTFSTAITVMVDFKKDEEPKLHKGAKSVG